MIKAVQGTLLHLNSSVIITCARLGKLLGVRTSKTEAEYEHQNTLIPPAIVKLIQPIYAQLGSKSLLEKCIDDYIQNGIFCGVVSVPKGPVDTGCTIAVCSWNDGMSSYQAIAEHMGKINATFPRCSLLGTINGHEEGVKQSKIG